jgi:hypothetical protein
MFTPFDTIFITIIILVHDSLFVVNVTRKHLPLFHAWTGKWSIDLIEESVIISKIGNKNLFRCHQWMTTTIYHKLLHTVDVGFLDGHFCEVKQPVTRIFLVPNDIKNEIDSFVEAKLRQI